MALMGCEWAEMAEIKKSRIPPPSIGVDPGGTWGARGRGCLALRDQWASLGRMVGLTTRTEVTGLSSFSGKLSHKRRALLSDICTYHTNRNRKATHTPRNQKPEKTCAVFFFPLRDFPRSLAPCALCVSLSPPTLSHTHAHCYTQTLLLSLFLSLQPDSPPRSSFSSSTSPPLAA